MAVELKVEGLEAGDKDNLRQGLDISDHCRPCLLATVRRQALPRHEEDKNRARVYRSKITDEGLVEGRTKGWWSLLSIDWDSSTFRWNSRVQKKATSLILVITTVLLQLQQFGQYFITGLSPLSGPKSRAQEATGCFQRLFYIMLLSSRVYSVRYYFLTASLTALLVLGYSGRMRFEV